jgi:hypothetical protein
MGARVANQLWSVEPLRDEAMVEDFFKKQSLRRGFPLLGISAIGSAVAAFMVSLWILSLRSRGHSRLVRSGCSINVYGTCTVASIGPLEFEDQPSPPAALAWSANPVCQAMSAETGARATLASARRRDNSTSFSTTATNLPLQPKIWSPCLTMSILGSS